MPTTPRWSLEYPDDVTNSDPPAGPAQIKALALGLDGVAMDDQGILANRPVSTSGSPGKKGRYYFVTGDSTASNNGILWRDHGTGWDTVRTGSETYSLIGASSPATPVNGDRWIAVDSLTNPSYQFQFRYNSGEATYHWECVGAGGAIEGTTSLTIPRNGDWLVEIGAGAQTFAAGDTIALTLTAGGITLEAGQGAGGGGSQSVAASAVDRGKMTALTAGQVLTPGVDLGGSAIVSRQYIRATPVRVS